jgi:hypothetical protein
VFSVGFVQAFITAFNFLPPSPILVKLYWERKTSCEKNELITSVSVRFAEMNEFKVAAGRGVHACQGINK